MRAAGGAAARDNTVAGPAKVDPVPDRYQAASDSAETSAARLVRAGAS